VRDHLPDYERAGAVVMGASPDSVAKAKRFHDKQGLNFKLLADEDHAVADAYGVWVEKSMYGKTYWGAQRATFIPKVSLKSHDEQVLKVLGDL
jgi:thioredoxin-dependent peroxiredoxin